MKLTEWLAIYAAMLSTGVFVWNYLQSRPRAKTEVIFGITTDHQAGIYVAVKNRSSHKIYLANISLLYQYRHVGIWERLRHLINYKRFPVRVGWVHSSLSLHQVSDGCPIAIEPRDSHEVFVPESVLRGIFKEAVSNRIAAVSQDKLWQDSYSSAMEYRIIDNEAEESAA